MRRLFTALMASCMLISAFAQSVTTASSTMTASPWAQQVPFDVAAEGKKFNFTTGMGGWSDIQFAYKQRNWVGEENLGVARLNFFGRNSTDAELPSTLSEEQISKGISWTVRDYWSDDIVKDEDGQPKKDTHNGIDTDLRIISPTGVKDILLLCDMDMRVRFFNESERREFWNDANRINYYVNDMALAVQYLESKGYNVISVAPFNEPDFDANKNCGQSAEIFNTVAAAMQKNPTLKGRVCGPNTLNTDPAVEWYATIKNNVDVINTHQLAGSFEHLVEFWDTGVKAGKRAVADEMHNVMEAMVVMNHGGEYGTWWGYDGVARAEFSRVTSMGRQLVYMEDAPKLAVAGVYRYDSDAKKDANRVKAIIGTSERQAVATNYTFVSKDRLAYYDGYGPAYDYTQYVQGGTTGGYQQAEQTNGERIINIYTGEDVPIESADGQYKIVNKASGKVLSTENGQLGDAKNVCQYADGAVNNQTWTLKPVSTNVGGDYSYHYITNSSNNSFHLDDYNWSLDEGMKVIIYPGGGSGCEQWHVRYVGDGYYTIINRHSGLCLEVQDGNTADGAGVVQMVVDESDAQLWKLVPINATIDAVAPMAPTGLAAISQSGGIKLTWEANVDEDVYAYMVYRFNDVVGIWECVGRKIQGTAFLDNTCRKGYDLRYRIRALDGSNNLSEPSEEIVASTSTEDALVAQWMGLSLKDNTQNKLHAVSNGVSYANDNSHPALLFDGNGSYVKLPYHVGDMQQMTFAAWVKGSSTTAWQRIFDFGNGEDEYLFLTPTNGNAMRFEIKKDGVTQGLNATTTLGTGTWKHVAVTIGADKVAIYIDGVANATTTEIKLRPSDIAPAMSYLGRSQFDADPTFMGMMSDVRLYNYALSADEVKNISSEIVSVDGLDITAERIPNVADDVVNWTVSGSWSTWKSTADGSGLSTPYVRIGSNGTSSITKTLDYLPEGTYTLSASCMSYYAEKNWLSTKEKDVTGVTFFAGKNSVTINTKNNKAAKTLAVQTALSGDNTLAFGINANSTNATILAMDDVKLVYQGTAADYIEELEAITEKMTTEASLLKGRIMSVAAKNALLDALKNVDQALNNYTEKIALGASSKTDVDEWIAAMKDVENVISTVKSSIEAYAPLGTQIAAARAKAARHPQETCESIEELGLLEIEGKYRRGEYADSEIANVVKEVKGVTNRYLLADAVVFGSASNPINVTGLVVEQAGFDNDIYAPWSATPSPGVSYGSVEFYNTNFYFSQILYGMPAGTYRLEARGFYRYGSQGNNHTAHYNGTLQRNAKLYLKHGEKTETADVMAISDDPSEIHEWGGWSSELYEGNPVPNNMQAASEAIDVRGKYAPKNGFNSVDINVTEIGNLIIGAKKETYVSEDWTFFGDFTLYYLGDGKRRIVLDEADTEAPDDKIDESIAYDKVILKRTLKAGVWNTFVSPFDIPADMLGGWEVKELTHSSYKDGSLSLTFDDADGIKAGVPYMVRNLSMTDDLTKIVMENVKLCATPEAVTTPEVAFVGVYNYGPMPEGAFFINNNMFYQVPVDGVDSNNNKSKAFRAYLMPQGEAAKARGLSYRTDGVVDEDDNDDENEDENGTSVGSITGGATVVAIYNANGVRVLDMQEGLNILQMSDGTRVKVMIR